MLPLARAHAPQVVSIVYNALAVYQTRLGLGLPVRLRPEVDAAEYSVVRLVTTFLTAK